MSTDRALTCRACCPSCGLHFGGNSAFDAHVTANGHRNPAGMRRKDGQPVLIAREGVCRLGPSDAVRAGAEAYERERTAARARSKAAGRGGLLSRAELDAVHRAADRAEAAAQKGRSEVPCTVWGGKPPEKGAWEGAKGSRGKGQHVTARSRGRDTPLKRSEGSRGLL